VILVLAGTSEGRKVASGLVKTGIGVMATAVTEYGGDLLRAAGVEIPVISGDGFDTPLLIELGGDGAREVYFSTHTCLNSDAPKVKDFVDAYTAEYGNAPENGFAALGYDAIYLVVDAIERAGSADPTAIRDALAETTGFEAVTGTISYTNGRCPEKSVSILKIEDGKFAFVEEVTP